MSRKMINNIIKRMFVVIIAVLSAVCIYVDIDHDATFCIVVVPFVLAVLIKPSILNFDIFEFIEDIKDDFKNW